MDFGLARKLILPFGATPGIGTEGYMAPGIRSSGNYGAEIDWFALGPILHYLLTGTAKEARPEGYFRYRDRVDPMTFDEPVFQGERGPVLRDFIEKITDPRSELFVDEMGGRLPRRQVCRKIRHHPFFAGVKWGEVKKRVFAKHPSPAPLGDAGAAGAEEALPA